MLREDYVREIRGQVLHTFSKIRVLDEEGNDVTSEKVHHLKTIDWMNCSGKSI